jgi:hypothetical protein
MNALGATAAHARSTTFLVSVALVAATGAAFAIGGLLLLWLAVSQAQHLGAVDTAAIVALMGATSFGVAVLGWLAAFDLWTGRERGWVEALVVSVLAVGGAISALAESGPQAPVLVGAALTLATFASLLAAAPRQRSGFPGSAA